MVFLVLAIFIGLISIEFNFVTILPVQISNAKKTVPIGLARGRERRRYAGMITKKSPLMLLNFCVAQGSVLGPLFFLIIINDLTFAAELMCKMFADDTTMYYWFNQAYQ